MLSIEGGEELIVELLRINKAATVRDYLNELEEIEREMLFISRKTIQLQNQPTHVMASVWRSHIECDGCGVKHEHLPGDDTMQLRRRSAAGAGWSYNNQKDLCPTCQPAKQAPKDDGYDNNGVFDGDRYFKNIGTL